MYKHLFFAALFCLAAAFANAQPTAQTEAKTLVTSGAASPPDQKTTTTNVVVEVDGRLYIQSTTVNQIETNSYVVGTKIEKLQEDRAKLDAQIAELQKLYFDLQKKEKKLKKDNEKGK